MTKLINDNAQFISEVYKEIRVLLLDEGLIVYYKNISSIGDNKFGFLFLKNQIIQDLELLQSIRMC